MGERSATVTVANFRIWDLGAGVWRYPLRKAIRERIVRMHGVAMEGTEEEVSTAHIDAEGWLVANASPAAQAVAW